MEARTPFGLYLLLNPLVSSKVILNRLPLKHLYSFLIPFAPRGGSRLAGAWKPLACSSSRLLFCLFAHCLCKRCEPLLICSSPQNNPANWAAFHWADFAPLKLGRALVHSLPEPGWAQWPSELHQGEILERIAQFPLWKAKEVIKAK